MSHGGGNFQGELSRGPSSLPQRIQILLEGKRLRIQAFSDAAVVALWKKAVDSARDAELSELSSDGALRAAYDAGHLAALALLAIHGLRTTSGPGHHEMAFAGAAAFGDAGLEELISDSSEIRALRSSSIYDPTVAGPIEVQRALAWIRKTLPSVRSALVTFEESLETSLASYPT